MTKTRKFYVKIYFKFNQKFTKSKIYPKQQNFVKNYLKFNKKFSQFFQANVILC